MFSSSEKLQIANSAQKLANEVNKALKVLRATHSNKTKLAKLEIIKNRIDDLKRMKQRYPFLTLFELLTIEAEIDKYASEYIQQGRSYESSASNISNGPRLDSKTSSAHKNSAKSLNDSSGRLCALAKQCMKLDLKMETIKLKEVDRPEYSAYRYFKSRGFTGAYCEGGAILTALKALCLDVLAQHNTFKSRADACNRYFEAQCTILADKKNLLLDAIQHTNKSRYLANFKEMYSSRYHVRSAYHGLSLDFMAKLYDCGYDSIFYNIANRFMEDPYQYRCGWPDLTLVKDDELRFVEVKTTDMLHKNQIITIQTMREVIPSGFSVIKVIKK